MSLHDCSSNAWQCRECGCDDMHACMDRGVPCHWVAPHLCSACAARKPSPARLEARAARRLLALRRNAGLGLGGRRDSRQAGFLRVVKGW